MVSFQPRKQRKALHNAPLHVRRRQVASHLAEDLLLKYNRRTATLVTGDEVRILRGDKKGKSGKIVAVDTKARRVTIEGVTHKKADGTEVALPLHPSNLLIVRLNMEDKRRREKFEAAKGDAPAKAPAKGAKGKSDKAAAKSDKPAKAPKADKAPAAKAPKADKAPAAKADTPTKKEGSS